MNEKAVPAHLGLAPRQGVELGRLCLLDEEPFNAESALVSRAFRLLKSEKPQIRGVFSCADPTERWSYPAGGEPIRVKRGHWGQVYQALNARYAGLTSRRKLWLTREGRVLSERSLSKIRNQESGADYAARQLVAAGAPDREPGEDPRSWVERSLTSGSFVRMLHPGNHVYTFGLDVEMRRHLERRHPGADTYPRRENRLAARLWPPEAPGQGDLVAA